MVAPNVSALLARVNVAAVLLKVIPATLRLERSLLEVVLFPPKTSRSPEIGGAFPPDQLAASLQLVLEAPFQVSVAPESASAGAAARMAMAMQAAGARRVFLL